MHITQATYIRQLNLTRDLIHRGATLEQIDQLMAHFQAEAGITDNRLAFDPCQSGEAALSHREYQAIIWRSDWGDLDRQRAERANRLAAATGDINDPSYDTGRNED